MVIPTKCRSPERSTRSLREGRSHGRAVPASQIMTRRFCLTIPTIDMCENPVYVNKKSTTTRSTCAWRILIQETRLEMEYEGTCINAGASIKGTTYIKGDKGGKLSLVGVENITMAPNSTKTPWPGQKLRFVLLFPPLPDNATEFDLIEPSGREWKYKDIKCK